MTLRDIFVGFAPSSAPLHLCTFAPPSSVPKPALLTRGLDVCAQNEFDADRSGHISTSEMGRVMKLLKLDAAPAKVKKLMKEANPSGDGQVSFKEFEAVLKKQMQGGGELAAVVEAGSSAGWFNPLSWFGSGAGDASVAAAEQAPPGSPDRRPGGSSSPNMSAYYQSRGPDSIRTLGEEFSPTHRMWATQGLVQVANRESAAEVKSLASAGKARKEAMKARFLEAQQEKVEAARQQEARKRQQEELLKYEKRYAGWEMKVKQQEMQLAEEEKRKQFASSANKRANFAKTRKARASKERLEGEAKALKATNAAAKEERAQRKELAKVTQRAEEEKARQYTAQIKFETRRELREEGKTLFQAQRDAIVAAEKAKQQEDAKVIEETRQRYLQRKWELKTKVESLHAEAKQARGRLDEQRRQDAADMRSMLEAERQRKKQQQEAAMAAKRGMRDELYSWKKEGIIGPAEAGSSMGLLLR